MLARLLLSVALLGVCSGLVARHARRLAPGCERALARRVSALSPCTLARRRSRLRMFEDDEEGEGEMEQESEDAVGLARCASTDALSS